MLLLKENGDQDPLIQTGITPFYQRLSESQLGLRCVPQHQKG